MLKNKMKKYIYNTIFWISRFITLFIFGICFTAVLNAKYLISESFFSCLMKTVYNISAFINTTFHINSNQIKYIFSLYTDPSPFRFLHIWKYNLCRSFSLNSQYIDIFLISAVSIIIVFLLCHLFFKNFNVKYKYHTFAIFSIFFTCVIFSFFTNHINFFILLIITCVVFALVNLFYKHRINSKAILLLPIITEVFYFEEILNRIKYVKSFNILLKTVYLLIISIIISNIMYIVFYFRKEYPIKPMMPSETYNLCVDNNTGKIIVSSNPFLYIIDNDNRFFLKEKYGFIQNISYNSIKKEIYIFDVDTAEIYTLSADSYEKLKTLNVENHFFAAFYCDEKNDDLVLCFENMDYYALLIDAKENIIKMKYNTECLNDNIIYNKFRDSYILSFFEKHQFVQELKRDSNEVKNLPMEPEQGYIAFSEQNKEVYIAYHQQGKIGVYDAQTMQLKRKIKSNYAVKDITYDEELNVLIAPSYFTGYVDIFLMDGSDKLLTRECVGYELREAKFDAKKENLYVCSRNGLYKIPINIKELIKNVSHETFNYNL